MSENSLIGSKWDIVIKELRKNQQKLGSYNDEVHIFRDISGQQRIKKVITRFLDDLIPSLKKSSQLSEEIRNEGNKIYKKNDQNVNLFEAAFLYTLSLKCSNTPSDLAYAHGNRAAVLMRLNFNKVARNDCEEAIKLNHPDPFKIYERMCSLSNACIKDMRKNVSELERFANQNQLKILHKYKMRLKAMEKETFVDEQVDYQENEKCNTSTEKNKLKVKQLYSEESGRYVAAEKALKKDDVIYTEDPFAFVPVHNYGIKKYFNTDCENCGQVNIWPFLCLECRLSSYCSSSCREQHFSNIHKYECEGYKKNLFSEIGIAHLSLRVLIVGFPSILSHFSQLADEEEDFLEFLKNNPEHFLKTIMARSQQFYNDYFSHHAHTDNSFYEYALVLCLQSNIFLPSKAFSMRNIPYVYTAYMLTVYLRQYTSFHQDFINSNNNKLRNLLSDNEWDLLISALIFRHIGQLVSNGHAIVDFRENIFTTDALKLMLHKNQANGGGLHLLLKSQRVFTGIFPKISMLNHSCAPNIRNVFEGKRLTIHALEDIPQNGEIFNCYGPHWKLMSYRERQDTLKLQYNFDCKCTKCLQMNDEYRFNNSILCKICNKRLFYPDRNMKIDDNDDDGATLNEDDSSDENFRLRCSDCNKIHDNIHMKKFFSLLAQQSECNFTMNQLYTTYLSAISGMGSLDEIRYHMTEMMLHTLITNRNAITSQNANIPLTLSIELLTVKESLYGQFSVEYVEAGFFFLDVLSILIDKEIISGRKGNQLIEATLKKISNSTDICSSNIRAIIQNYIARYCYLGAND